MRCLRAAAVLALSAPVLLAGAGAAVASTPTSTAFAPSLTIRRVDTTAFPTVRIDAQIVDAPNANPGFTVRENGAAVSGLTTTTLGSSGESVGTALVLDTAASMADQSKLTQLKVAAKQYVAQKLPNELVALIATGASPRVVSNFTSNTRQLDAQIDSLAAEGEMALYDGIQAASALFVARPELLANIVVIADRADTLSRVTAAQALGAEGAAKAVVFTVGLVGGNGLDPATLRALAIDGGQYIAAPNATDLPAALASIQKALQSAFALTFTSKPNLSSLDLVVSSSGMQAVAHTVPGAIAAGSNVDPEAVHLRQAPGPLRGSLGVGLIALLALAAAGLLGYAILTLATTERSTLAAVLLPYARGAKPIDDDDTDGSLVQTALVARAVETTGRIAKEQGVLDRVEVMLEQADLVLRPAEALFFYLAGVVIVGIAAVALEGPIIGFIVLILAGMAPPAVLSFLAGRRVRRFNAQLPDTLQLLSSSLRAGFSFLQGVEAVAAESAKPMGDELRRVMIEARLGRPVEEALQDCADRMRSPDFDWAVMAVRIQREVGGNLAELLQTVGETMIERERLRRDVKSLTAEGRVSAIVLGIMPPALGLIFYVSNPSYMKVLFTHVGGQIALAVAVVAMIGGFLWMKKIVNIEV